MQLLFSNNLCAAYLAEIVDSFQKHHANHYLGRTAMQKLAYFSQAVGVPIPCSFEIYNYGPYSDAITFTVESMVADDLLEDRSLNRKYSNYRLADSDVKFDSNIQKSVSKHRDRIDNVVKVLGRFDPAQLELIATLHFIANRRKSLTGEVSKKEVEDEFFRIKGNKFSREDVRVWYDALESANLV
jgi:uncharacterized protein YwgA